MSMCRRLFGIVALWSGLAFGDMPKPVFLNQLSERQTLYLETLEKLHKASRPVKRTVDGISVILFDSSSDSGRVVYPFWRTLGVPAQWLSPPAWVLSTKRDIFDLLNREIGYDPGPVDQTALLADKVDAVRVLGGWKKGGRPEDVDVVTRDDLGALVYHWERLFSRLDPIVKNGLTPFVVLDNVPFALAPAHEGDLPSYGQNYAPKDFEEWGRFIEDLCRALAEHYGESVAGSWRYRIGTELDNPNHWESRHPDSLEKYLKTYDYATAAIKRVFPNAKVGPGNFNSMFAGQLNRLVDPYKMFDHFANGTNYATGAVGSPVDFVSFSCYGQYYAGGAFDHPDAGRYGYSPEVLRMHVHLMRELRSLSPRFSSIPIEVHEHGLLENENEEKSPEPGVFGGAWLAANYAVALQENLGEVFFWSDFRSIGGQSMLFGSAWIRAMMEKMVGGEFFDPQIVNASNSNLIYAYGIRQKDRLWIVISNLHADRAVSQSESMDICFAPDLRGKVDFSAISEYRLTKKTSPYDVMFSDLADRKELKAGINVLGNMATEQGEGYITGQIDKYWKLQEALFQPKPFSGSRTEQGIHLTVETPEVRILEIPVR